ncbi:1,2-dihydroxy-3-keto-5-methylthiopentene dioxygenase [Nannocystis pusilla]|uniref:1,2-dihydroxy-3-keto-5-methylthiopentene dioxygenase n=1 Tax=Nannocystis pusilla TaxID=889268 RepID=UPI003BF39C91
MQLAWLEDSLHGPSAVGSLRGEGPTLADLAAVGVLYERLPDDDFQGALDRLKAARGYVAQDVIELRPDTPNLDGLLAKFKDEHLHRDDEVRFVLDGEGIFDIRGADERWIRVQVERGDLIVVPADLYHRFFLTERRQIRCVRLFKDAAGWVPEYRA